jgi:cysteine desulfurase/selenocysteine lyase
MRIQRLFAGNSLPEIGSRPLDVPTIRRDFPVLNQQVHGKPLVWLDKAVTLFRGNMLELREKLRYHAPLHRIL